MTERELLTALGGAKSVARYVGLGLTAVSNWQVDASRSHGIPYRYHGQLIQLAKEKRVAGVNFEMLSEMRTTREAKDRIIKAQKKRRLAANARNDDQSPIEGRAA